MHHLRRSQAQAGQKGQFQSTPATGEHAPRCPRIWNNGDRFSPEQRKSPSAIGARQAQRERGLPTTRAAPRSIESLPPASRRPARRGRDQGLAGKRPISPAQSPPAKRHRPARQRYPPTQSSSPVARVGGRSPAPSTRPAACRSQKRRAGHITLPSNPTTRSTRPTPVGHRPGLKVAVSRA